MKWSVVALMVLGVGAALCAGLLVMALAAGHRPGAAGQMGGQEATATVLVAARELPPMTVIDDGCVKAISVPRGKSVTGAFTSPVEIAGKVLAVSLVPGQAFTPNCFAGDGSLVRLAGTLPAGKRAMAIAVTDHGGLDGVLYPGSIVDVLASFKAESGEGFSTVLVSGVEVLAVERLTVIGDSDGGKRELTAAVITEAVNAARGAGGNANTRRVTLLVDLKQAKSLQLAMEHGTISLVLRNPHDATKAGTEALWTSSIVQESGARARDAWAKVVANLAAAAAAHGRSGAVAATTTQPPTSAPAKPATPPPPQWQTIIIRGSAVETRQFEMPAAAAAAVPVGSLSQTR
jgi:pilus assembly protein CpaB